MINYGSIQIPGTLQDGLEGFWRPRIPIFIPRNDDFLTIWLDLCEISNTEKCHFLAYFPTFDLKIVENLHIFGVWGVQDPSMIVVTDSGDPGTPCYPQNCDFLTIWLDLCEISDTEKSHFLACFPTF